MKIHNKVFGETWQHLLARLGQQPPVSKTDAKHPQTSQLATTSPETEGFHKFILTNQTSLPFHNKMSLLQRGTMHINNGQRHACHRQNVMSKCQQRSADAKNNGASSTIATHGATAAMPSEGSISSRLSTAALCLQRRGRLTAAATLRAPQRRHGFPMLQRTEPFQSILRHSACLDRAEAIMNTLTKESTELKDGETN